MSGVAGDMPLARHRHFCLPVTVIWSDECGNSRTQPPDCGHDCVTVEKPIIHTHKIYGESGGLRRPARPVKRRCPTAQNTEQIARVMQVGDQVKFLENSVA